MKLADFARLRRLLHGGGTDLLGAVNTSRNNTSIVTRWHWKDVTLLLTGDAELESWHYLRENGTNVGATLVKVGHHGSINASPAWAYEEVFPAKRASNAVLLSTNPAIFDGINPDPHPDVVAGWNDRLRYANRLRRTNTVARGASVEVVFEPDVTGRTAAPALAFGDDPRDPVRDHERRRAHRVVVGRVRAGARPHAGRPALEPRGASGGSPSCSAPTAGSASASD